MGASCLPGEAVQARMGLRLGEAVRHRAESRRTAVPEEKRLSAEAVASLFIVKAEKTPSSIRGR